MTRETLNSRGSTGDVLERLHLDCNLEWCKNYRIIGKRPEQDCATFFISYTIVDVRLYFYWSGHKQAVLADCLIIWKDQHFVWWLFGNPNVCIAILDISVERCAAFHHPKSPVTAVIWIPSLANSSALVQVENWIKWRCRPPSSVKFTVNVRSSAKPCSLRNTISKASEHVGRVEPVVHRLESVLSTCV